MRIVIILILLCVLPGQVPPTHATQVRSLSPEQLGAAASDVVRGRVATTRSYWNPEHTKIYTEVVLDAEEAFKGTATGALRILQLGGTVDGVRVTVHGALGWTPGEEVLVFLERYQDGRFVVSGLSQGKFSIVRDPASGEAFVTRLPLADIEFVGADGGKAAVAGFEKIPLGQFVRKSLGTVPERHEN